MKHSGILILGKSDYGFGSFFSMNEISNQYRSSIDKIVVEHIDTVILCDDSVDINDVIEFCQKNELNLLSLSGEKVNFPEALKFVFNEMSEEYNENSILSTIKRMREIFKNMKKSTDSLISTAQAS